MMRTLRAEDDLDANTGGVALAKAAEARVGCQPGVRGGASTVGATRSRCLAKEH